MSKQEQESQQHHQSDAASPPGVQNPPEPHYAPQSPPPTYHFASEAVQQQETGASALSQPVNTVGSPELDDRAENAPIPVHDPAIPLQSMNPYAQPNFTPSHVSTPPAQQRRDLSSMIQVEDSSSQPFHNAQGHHQAQPSPGHGQPHPLMHLPPINSPMMHPTPQQTPLGSGFQSPPPTMGPFIEYVADPHTVTPLNLLSGDQPQWIDCHFCKRRTMTRVAKEGSTMQTVVGAIICLACVCLTCLPCLLHWFEDTLYMCSNCNRMVAKRPHDGPIQTFGPVASSQLQATQYVTADHRPTQLQTHAQAKR